MPKPTFVELPNAAVEHMSLMARGHLPEHLQGNFPAVGANLEGATISYSFLAGHGGLPAQDLTVGRGVELPNFPGFGNPVGSMDISSASLVIHFTSTGSFPDGRYEFMLTDPYNQVPDITAVTLVNGGGTSFTQSGITFDANEVTVNLAGTSYTAGNEIMLNFQFL